jgi:aldose 1-epimerase
MKRLYVRAPSAASAWAAAGPALMDRATQAGYSTCCWTRWTTWKRRAACTSRWASRSHPALLLQPAARRALPEGRSRHRARAGRAPPSVCAASRLGHHQGRGPRPRPAETIITSTLELRAGELRLALRPDLGGSIAGLWLGRPARAAQHRAGDLASRALGLLSAGAYSATAWATGASAGRARTTPPRPTSTTARTRCTAWPGSGPGRCRPAAPRRPNCATRTPRRHWPFAFELRQRFVLTPTRCRCTCLHQHARPAAAGGSGLAPLLPQAHAQPAACRADRPLGQRRQRPAHARVPQPGIDGDVANLAFDHCFEGWRGAARMRDEKLSLR